MTTSDWINKDRYSINRLFPLEGFEKVLGMKYSCRECKFYRKNQFFPEYCSAKRIMGDICNEFYLSDKTKAEIKLHDYELYPAGKIDTHPRFFIREEMMYYIKEEPPSSFMNFNPNKNIPIRQALFKLELIL